MRKIYIFSNLVMDDPLLVQNPGFGNIKDRLMTFSENKDDLTDKIDFVVCLGGDGTLLYASSLFQQSVPPIMAFHLGSLGFLTPFKFEDFRTQVPDYLISYFRKERPIKKRVRSPLIRQIILFIFSSYRLKRMILRNHYFPIIFCNYF